MLTVKGILNGDTTNIMESIIIKKEDEVKIKVSGIWPRFVWRILLTAQLKNESNAFP